ncbi:MAG: hypothetical protein IPK71_07945 [Myxococcales bacterium]|nr:hypothetical protein [Myxococcales bacterium]
MLTRTAKSRSTHLLFGCFFVVASWVVACGPEPTGTCVYSMSMGWCTVNDAKNVCLAGSRTEFFPEKGAAGEAKCRALGFTVPQNAATRKDGTTYRLDLDKNLVREATDAVQKGDRVSFNKPVH